MGAWTLHKTMSSRSLQYNLSNREHLVGRNEQVSRNSCALVYCHSVLVMIGMCEVM